MSANSPNWAEIENVQGFMRVLVICKFDEDPIRNEVSISKTTFSPLYVYGSLKGQVTLLRTVRSGPKSNVQDCMPFFVIRKFDKGPIKNKVAIALTLFNFSSDVQLMRTAITS